MSWLTNWLTGATFLLPAGPVASADTHLFLIVAVVLVFVAAPVLALTPIMALLFRWGSFNFAYRPQWTFSWILEVLIWLPPAGIVVGLSALVWIYTHRLDPYRPVEGQGPPLEVQVVGFDWKWLFIYPEQHIATVNMLAVPVGRPVHMSITSGSVMQSLFMPRLAGQIYAMPGMKTQLNFAADRPGSFEGKNTQFSGFGFQDQRFTVQALAPAAFDGWVSRVQASGKPLDGSVYARIACPSTIPRALAFASAPANLFDHIMMHPSDGPAACGAQP